MKALWQKCTLSPFETQEFLSQPEVVMQNFKEEMMSGMSAFKNKQTTTKRLPSGWEYIGIYFWTEKISIVERRVWWVRSRVVFWSWWAKGPRTEVQLSIWAGGRDLEAVHLDGVIKSGVQIGFVQEEWCQWEKKDLIGLGRRQAFRRQAD